MKLLFVLLLSPIGLIGQEKELLGIWYSTELDYIEFTHNYWTIQNKEFQKQGFTRFEKCANDFRFLYEYYDSNDSNKIKVSEDNYDLKLVELTKDYIIFAPTSKKSREFFQERETIQFFQKDKLCDPDLKFEKLVYKIDNFCEFYGGCPSLKIEIDSSRNFKYEGKHIKENNLTGSFIGKITEKDYDELINLIKCIPLNKLHWSNGFCSHSPQSVFVVNYNGKKRTFKSGCGPPEIAIDLIKFLNTMNSKATMQKTSKVLEFEN